MFIDDNQKERALRRAKRNNSLKRGAEIFYEILCSLTPSVPPRKKRSIQREKRMGIIIE